MGANLLNATFTGFDEDINILATNDYEAPISRTLDLTYLQANSDGAKLVRAGSVICNIPSSDYVRVYPLTTVAAALASSDTTVTVADAKLFKASEALVILRPYATLTFAGTVAATNTITLTLQGQALTYTLVAGDTTATITATSFAAFINTGVASDKVLAISSGAIVYFYAKTGIPYTFTTSVTGGGVTSSASAAVMQENVAIARHLSTTTNLWNGILGIPPTKMEEIQTYDRALELLELVGLSDSHDVKAKNFSYGDQRRLEIARALALQPKLLLLDEPAAGMNPNEKGQLSDFIRSLRDRFALTILLIEHHVPLVMGLCDRIAVLDFGQLIAIGQPEIVKSDRAVIEAYLGDEA